jgi:hypothetical protein
MAIATRAQDEWSGGRHIAGPLHGSTTRSARSSPNGNAPLRRVA